MGTQIAHEADNFGGAKTVFADVLFTPPRCIKLQLVVFVSFRTTPLNNVTHVVQDKDRKGRQALFLLWT